MPIQTSPPGKTKRQGKTLSLSPLSRLLLEREAQDKQMSLSRIVEQLIETRLPEVIREEQAAIKALTAELEAKRKQLQPPFKSRKRERKEIAPP
jgi:hypothetical protein